MTFLELATEIENTTAAVDSLSAEVLTAETVLRDAESRHSAASRHLQSLYVDMQTKMGITKDPVFPQSTKQLILDSQQLLREKRGK